MALGGGNFVGQSKILPGAYINFVSLARAGGTLSERGAAAFPLTLDWGNEGELFSVTAQEFVKNSLSIFGYDYAHAKLTGIRELFCNAAVVYGYRLGEGAVAASCEFGRARYGGERGNDITVSIAADGTMFNVRTLVDGVVVDSQTAASAEQLTDNDFVLWNDEAVLTATAATHFSGGENAVITTADYQKFLSKIESCPVNAVGVCSDDPAVNMMFAQFAKTTRDEAGVKLQCVVFNCPADHEGVVNVKNSVQPVDGVCRAGLTYWVTGAVAGCEVNRSNLNRVYDGELAVMCDYTQSQLEDAIVAGEFTLHKVAGGRGQRDTLRVLADINSLTTVTDEKGEVFRDNQTVRVIDQIATDIAALFNSKYLGNVPNDDAGRVSLWADIVKHHEELARIRAIEEFSDSDVEVLPGDDKRSVVVNDRVTVVNAMAQVYMTCVIA